MLQVLKAQPRTGSVELQLSGTLATLVLRRPEKRNAMSAAMMVDLAEAVTRLDDWQGSLLVVRGESGHFCAGADLQLVQGPLATKEAGVAMATWMTSLLNRVRRAPYVSVSLIEGAAMGGGAELATATDFRLLSNTARLQFVQAARGVSPGWGGAARLVEIVGRTRALHLLATATRIPPQEAIRIGLAEELFEPGRGNECLEAFMGAISSHDPQAIRACKKSVLGGAEEGLFSKMELEAFSEVWGGESQKRAMAQALKGKST